MMQRKKAFIFCRFLLVLTALLLLPGCSRSAQTETATDTASDSALSGDWSPTDPIVAVFHAESAAGEKNAWIDLSQSAAGYAAVQAENENRLKLQVICGEKKYNYDLPGDKSTLIVPLQSGDGEYTLRVLQNTTESKYVEIFSVTEQVTLENDFSPFVCSSTMVSFDADSLSTEKARELSAGITSDAAFVSKVYAYLKDAIAYDYDFAESEPAMYYPDPDATLQSGKGICFDYAATAAAMLRACGVPTKLVTGFVTPGDIYHAWNEIYLKDQGWITMEIRMESGEWQVLDVTFAATGASGTVGDGISYKELDVY